MSSKIMILACFLTFTAIASTGSSFIGSGKILDIPRIIGGKQANRGQFPHLVAIETYSRTKNDAIHKCGGSILNSYWILTAAHCALDSPNPRLKYQIQAGKYEYKNSKGAVTVEVEKRIRHEKYNQEEIIYDIALLKLKEPLAFNVNVQPIKLPQKNSQVDGDVVAAGWGGTDPNTNTRPKFLQDVTLPIIDFDTCKEAVQKSPKNRTLNEHQICTGPVTDDRTNVKSLCDGDSGGPLMKYKRGGEPELVGVASWTFKPCGAKGLPSIFTKVSSFIDWIQSNMDKN